MASKFDLHKRIRTLEHQMSHRDYELMRANLVIQSLQEQLPARVNDFETACMGV
jgi:hypothetical protein